MANLDSWTHLDVHTLRQITACTQDPDTILLAFDHAMFGEPSFPSAEKTVKFVSEYPDQAAETIMQSLGIKEY